MEIEKGTLIDGREIIKFQDMSQTSCNISCETDSHISLVVIGQNFAEFSQEDIKTLLPYLQSFAQTGTLELHTFLPLQKLMMDWADLIKNFTPYDSGVGKETWDTWYEQLNRETDQYMVTLAMTGIPKSDFVAQITSLRQLVQSWLNPLQGGGLLEESIQDERTQALEQLVKDWMSLNRDRDTIADASQQHLWEECCEEIERETAQLLGEKQFSLIAQSILTIIKESTKPPKNSYIAGWHICDQLGVDRGQLDCAIPGTQYDKALEELIDAGVVEEMPDLGCRYRLAKNQEPTLQGGTAESKIYHRALEIIRDELTSFDPDGDCSNHDREQACEEVLKIVGVAIGDEKVESDQDKQIKALKQLVRGWRDVPTQIVSPRILKLQEQTAQLLGEETTDKC